MINRLSYLGSGFNLTIRGASQHPAGTAVVRGQPTRVVIR
jgi:hypothetical protein